MGMIIPGATGTIETGTGTGTGTIETATIASGITTIVAIATGAMIATSANACTWSRPRAPKRRPKTAGWSRPNALGGPGWGRIRVVASRIAKRRRKKNIAAGGPRPIEEGMVRMMRTSTADMVIECQ